MEKQEAQRRLAELREQVRYHSRKYYTEDDPEIDLGGPLDVVAGAGGDVIQHQGLGHTAAQ